MPDWLIFVLFAVVVMGGTVVSKKLKLLPPPKVDSNAPRLNLAATFAGTVTNGKMTSSPGQVSCVAYGVVFGRMEGEDNDVFVELHRGGWTEGFDIRTKEGSIISVPKGSIHVDGEWDEAHGRVDASTYLAAADVSGEAANAVLSSRAQILEVHVKANANVTVHATRFDEAHNAEPAQEQQGHAYRQGLRNHVAQGDILVRAG